MRREHELHQRRRGRNLGVLVVLLGFAALMFGVTIAKLGAGPGTVGNPSAAQGGAWIDGFLQAVNPPEENQETTTAAAPSETPSGETAQGASGPSETTEN